MAQVLDYGATLWRKSFDEVAERCAGDDTVTGAALEIIVAERCVLLDAPFDANVFSAGVESSLDAGNFVFLYVGRDLDERTRRIMTYLAPARSAAGALADAPPEFHQLLARMDSFAAERGLMVKAGKTGRNYQPRDPVSGVTYTSGVGIYATTRGAEFNLLVFRELGRHEAVDEMRRRIVDLTGTTPSAAVWPSFPWEILARDWELSRSTVIEPYFDARAKLHER